MVTLEAIQPDKVTKAIETLSNFILNYAVALAAVGALSMALLEAWKVIFKTREGFYMRALEDWINDIEVPSIYTKKADNFRQKVYDQIIFLTTGTSRSEPTKKPGCLKSFFNVCLEVLLPKTFIARYFFWTPIPKQALFSLELEKMMGKIQDAADLSLNNPGPHNKELFLFLTIGANEKDIKNWSDRHGKSDSTPKPDPNKSKADTRAENGDTKKPAMNPDNTPQPNNSKRDEAKEFADLYSRLHQHIRSRLDGFQLITGYRWKRRNQILAVSLGLILLMLVLGYLYETPRWQDWLIIFLCSMFGGLVAPAAKDLVVALRKVREGA